ncbi:hypothetical protein HYY74_04575 [Candidatus Woesearchaeota archaeon]|nr:hypothetical protein [Candidatus Woesearchaeota archaeon]
MVNLGWGLTANIIGLIWPVITALRQKHFVKRDDAVYCGLSLIVIAVGLIFDNSALKLWQLPLYAYPLIQGLLGIGLVVKREELGNVILSGWATAVMGAVVLLAQISN